MQTEQEHAGACVHLIRLTIKPDDSVDLGQITRAICDLGGVATEQGYAFTDTLERSLALEVLIDRFGCRYVDTFDTQRHEGNR